MLAIDIDPFQIGDLVKYVYYDWEGTQLAGGNPSGAECRNIGFIVDIIEDPDEKQVDLFPKVLVYDTRLRKTVLTHAYNIEFVSRAP